MIAFLLQEWSGGAVTPAARASQSWPGFAEISALSPVISDYTAPMSRRASFAIASWALGLITGFASTSASAAPSAGNSTCLLAGPSDSLLLLQIERDSDQGLRLRRIAGQAWPFSTETVPLAVRDSVFFRTAAPDRAANLMAEVSVGLNREQVMEVRLFRGESTQASLVLFAGSCPAPGQPDRYPQSLKGEAAKRAASTDRLRSGTVYASPSCQVASASGWRSRFTIALEKDHAHYTVTPADRHIWSGNTARYAISGLPLPSEKSWLRVAWSWQAVDEHDPLRNALNGIWVYARPDDQQVTAYIDFFGFVSPATGIKEDLSGICAKFVAPETHD